MTGRRPVLALLVSCWLFSTLLSCGEEQGPGGAGPATPADGARSTPVAVVVATGDPGLAQLLPTVTLAARPPTSAATSEGSEVDEEVGNVVPDPATPTRSIAAPTDIDEELINVVPSTPAPEFTQAPPPDNLDQELFVGLGGGDGGFCFSPPSEGGLPVAEGQVFNYHMGYLCLWGFDLGGTVYVELYDPEGQMAGAREYPVVDERSGVSVIQLLPWFAGRPTGEWSVAASGTGASLWHSFFVGEPEYPVLSAAPGGADDVLGGEGWLFCDQNVAYNRESVILLGAGLPPDARLPLGIYYQAVMSSDVPAQLVSAEWLFTDEQGHAVKQFDTREVPEPGTYFAVVVLEPGYQPVQGSFDPAGANACFVVGP